MHPSFCPPFSVQCLPQRDNFDEIPFCLCARMLVLVSALLLVGCMTAPAQDAPLWLGQTAEGARITPVALTSWKDRKFVAWCASAPISAAAPR